MKPSPHAFSILAVLVLATAPADASPTAHDLARSAADNRIHIFNRAILPAGTGAADADEGEDGVLCVDARPGDGLVWIDGVSLGEGTIELEIRGEDRPGQSFVGVAFHGQDDKTFEAVYLRPFNFQAAEPERRAHAIQYISMPEHDWRVLRSAHPGKYEAALDPAPQPTAWVRLKLEVSRERIAAFINGAESPALEVERLGAYPTGNVGLWVGHQSSGAFRHLVVSPGTP